MSSPSVSAKHLSRREFLRWTGAAAAGGAAFVRQARSVLAAEGPAGRRKPNIIFILADDLGYGDVGCYGQKRIRTPHIDKLAEEGVRFTQAYAGSTVCAPSRCCLMTGLHTGHCRVRGNARVPLEPADLTVAELLKGAGYATGLIGKWGLGEPGTTGVPTRQGFDYFFGYLNQHHAHNYYPTFLWRNEQKVPLKNVVPNEDKVGGGMATKRVQYSHDLFAQEALEFVERNKDKPFFLYLAFTIPHANNEARAKGMEVPSDAPYTDEDWPQAQKNHAAMITRMDADIGRLVAKLKELGIDNDTAIFFSSDNGPHREGGARPEFFDSNGPLRGIKRDLYEGGIRVPTIVRWPGRVKPGTGSSHVWGFWDFLPTAAEIAGAKPPKDIDGISFLPAMLGREQKEHDFLYWEFHERGGQQAVRMGKWKAVGRFQGPMELYDLTADLGEQNDLARKDPGAAKPIVEKIAAYLATARTESKHWRMRARRPKRG